MRDTKSRSERKRAAGYVRVSTRGQERGMGLAAQRDRIREYAKSQGYDLAGISEEAASGAVKEGEVFSHAHRPILSELIERAGRGEFDVLLVATFDRLSRDYMTLLFLKRLLKSYGVEAVSTAEENGNGDAIGELIEQIIASIHEFERKRILERIQGGKRKRKERGQYVGGKVPFAYRAVRQRADDGGAELEPNLELAPIVRRIFDDAAHGYTPGRIADSLNGEAIPGPTGKRWNRTTVRAIIENSAYAGERYGVKRAHRAIVSRKLYGAANEKLRDRARPRS